MEYPAASSLPAACLESSTPIKHAHVFELPGKWNRMLANKTPPSNGWQSEGQGITSTAGGIKPPWLGETRLQRQTQVLQKTLPVLLNRRIARPSQPHPPSILRPPDRFSPWQVFSRCFYRSPTWPSSSGSLLPTRMRGTTPTRS